MKKALLIIIPIVLVLCVVCAGVLYFVWNKSGTQLSDLTSKLQNQPITNTITATTGVVVTSTPDVTSTEPQITSSVCDMLTAEIAKQVLGGEVKSSGSGTTACTYTTSSEDYSKFGVITMVVTNTDALSAKAQFDSAKSSVYKGTTEAVTGLNADEAYYATNIKQLSILKGGSWIIISGVSDNYANEKELAVATAKLVLK